jgi:hypothetical protein
VAKEYEIHNITDLAEMYSKMINYQQALVNQKKPFEAMRITSKRLRGRKTPAQHKAYWRCIGELKKALFEAGTIVSNDELHEWVKIKSGFVKYVKIPGGETMCVTKSISDGSNDVNIENINFLIDWIISWARDFLNYEIEIN